MHDIHQIVDFYLLEEQKLLHEAHQQRPTSEKPHESTQNLFLLVG
jgi:hypothetical protein